jgi:hypothetical protein
LYGNKKTLYVRFAFNSNSPQIEHIAKKNTKRNKKKIQSGRGPKINQQRSQIIFEFLLISKRARLAKYHTKMGIKIMVKA